MIDVQTLRRLLSYDAKTGELRWLTRSPDFFKKTSEFLRWNGRYAGKVAFSINTTGYRDGMIFRKVYRAHQVAWALHYGEWPHGPIDHINGVRDDNRIENLRIVTPSENSRNRKQSKRNKTGATGVVEFKPGRWRAYIGTDAGNIHLGVFYSMDEAVGARKLAEIQHGYHPNHGRPA